MQYMTCNRCRKVVQVNNTGICMGCQLGMAGPLEEEAFKPTNEQVSEKKRNNCGIIPQKEEDKLDRLQQRKEELEATLRQAQSDARLRQKKEKKDASKKRKK